MTPRFLLVLIVLALTGCGAPALPPRGAESPLAYDRADVARAPKLAILVPGAFASGSIFAPAGTWRDAGYALVYYRLPGLDGLPLDHALRIETAADTIAEFARQHPDKKIRLFGYSAGGPIVIEAARRLEGRDIRAAALAPSPDHAGGIRTTLRGTLDLIGAARRAGTFDRDAVWEEYYRVLLFGRAGLADPELAELSRRIAAEQRGKILVPDREMARAHTRDLRQWRLEPVPDWLQPRVRIYLGREDPIFSLDQTLAVAQKAGDGGVYAYPRQGHLMFLTGPRVFDDVLAFFEDP